MPFGTKEAQILDLVIAGSGRRGEGQAQVAKRIGAISADDVALQQFGEALQKDLEIGFAVAINVALQHASLVAELARPVVKFLRADEEGELVVVSVVYIRVYVLERGRRLWLVEADVRDPTMPAFGFPRLTDIAPMQDQPMVAIVFVTIRNHAQQFEFDL